jgi:hypothetical protein
MNRRVALFMVASVVALSGVTVLTAFPSYGPSSPEALAANHKISGPARLKPLQLSTPTATPTGVPNGVPYNCDSVQDSGDCLEVREVENAPSFCNNPYSSHIVYFDIWACILGECDLSATTAVMVNAYSGDPGMGGTFRRTGGPFYPLPGSSPYYDHFEGYMCFSAGQTVPDFFVFTIDSPCGLEDVTVRSCCITSCFGGG